VFLAGDRALKLKRAVKLPYLDFSTVARRRAACEAELAVNRRTAPDLYLDVVPVVRRGDGTLAVGGAGAVLDWLVVMRRFDQSTLFDKRAARGVLSEGDVVAAAEAIARFHAGAERAAGGADILARIIAGNRESVRRAAVPRPLSAERAEAIDAACLARLDAVRPVLDRRGAEGRVRDGHGDLHLRNICLVGGKPVLFDAIEFDPDFRRIDVFYDFAFLLMDLLHRALPRHANGALNAYLAATGDLGGLATLPLFLGVRAVIRGHIQATVAGGAETGEAGGAAWAEAGAYFDLAQAALAPPAAALLAIGGLSGTGKTTVARALAPRLGALPGALVLRSDVLRKRLAGVAETERLPQDFYTEAWSGRVYAEMERIAAQALAQGHAVVADAVSGAPAQRRGFEALARRAGVRFAGLWLDAPLAVREARLDRRTGDASDADAAVARRQRQPEALGWMRVDAAGDIARTVADAARAAAAAGVCLRAD
jgi:aminoglycoside phosphotransferase family enzyme/predicted kinase